MIWEKKNTQALSRVFGVAFPNVESSHFRSWKTKKLNQTEAWGLPICNFLTSWGRIMQRIGSPRRKGET